MGRLVNKPSLPLDVNGQENCRKPTPWASCAGQHGLDGQGSTLAGQGMAVETGLALPPPATHSLQEKQERGHSVGRHTALAPVLSPPCQQPSPP